MSETKLYTVRSNAKRDAEKMIAKGTAPALDYGIKVVDGKFEIIWKIGEESGRPTVEECAKLESDISEHLTQDESVAEQVADAAEETGESPEDERDAETLANSVEPEPVEAKAPTMAVRYLTWHNAIVEALPKPKPGQPKRTTLPVDDALVGALAIGKFEQREWQKGDRHYLMLTFADDSVVNIAADDGPAPRNVAKARPIGNTTAAKNAAGWEAPQAASEGKAPNGAAKTKTPRKRAATPALKPGEMPVKPEITSAANKSYQGRVDALAKMADERDLAAIEAFVVKGVNTYAKVVTRYRDALVEALRLSV